jgi:hypothetical protein
MIERGWSVLLLYVFGTFRRLIGAGEDVSHE